MKISGQAQCFRTSIFEFLPEVSTIDGHNIFKIFSIFGSYN